MKFYLELALRLLWGSRLNVSTRMTAFMAMGMLALTGACAIVMISVSQGFGNMLDEKIQQVEQLPDLSLTFVAQDTPETRPEDLAKALKSKSDMIHEFKALMGQGTSEAWHYKSISSFFVPEKNLLALQDIALEKQNSQDTPTPLASGRTERLEQRRAASRAWSKAQLDTLNTGLTTGSLCQDLTHSLSNQEAWISKEYHAHLQRIPGGFHLQDRLMIGPGHSMEDPYGGRVGSVNPHKAFQVTRVRDEQNLPVNCIAWVSGHFFDVLKRRGVFTRERIDAWSERDTLAFQEKWFPDDLKTLRRLDEEGNLVLFVELDTSSIKDAELMNAMQLQTVKALQDKMLILSTILLSFISSYQIAALMMLLGVQFRFEIAMYRSLGMGQSKVMLLFVMASALLFLIGMGAGAVIGYALILNHLPILDFIDSVGVNVSHFRYIDVNAPLTSFWMVLFGGMTMGSIAGILPAYFASKTPPATIWSSEA